MKAIILTSEHPSSINPSNLAPLGRVLSLRTKQMLAGRNNAGAIAGSVSLLHTAKWGIVPLDGAPDGSEVSFIPESSRCRPRPQGSTVPYAGSATQAVAAGGRVGVSLPRAGRYIACLQDGRALSTVVKVVDMPPRQVAFGCEQFGSLCPPLGAGVLSPHDVQFARSRRLKVFVYRDLPASFHDKIIQDGLPPEVRRGQICDFFSAPCSPSGKPALMRRLENWFTTMKNVPDAPLLTKLLALASVPGVGTLDPAEVDAKHIEQLARARALSPAPALALTLTLTLALTLTLTLTRPPCSSSPSSEASWSTTRRRRRAASTLSRSRTT